MTKRSYSSAAWLTSVLLSSTIACSDAGSDRQNAPQSGPSASADGKGAAADSREYSASAGSTGSADAGAPVKLEDPQISVVLSSINAAELEEATLATDKAQTEAVQAYARDIAASALAAQERLTNLAATASPRDTLNIGDAENPLAEQLQADARRNVALLQNTDGARVDGLYLQSQIDLLRQVIVASDQTFLPSVQNPLLRVEVQRTRGDSVVYLERARTLAAATELDSDAGTADSDAGN